MPRQDGWPDNMAHSERKQHVQGGNGEEPLNGVESQDGRSPR